MFAFGPTGLAAVQLQVGILQFSSQVKVELGPSTFQAPDFSAAVEKMVRPCPTVAGLMRIGCGGSRRICQ